MDQKKNEEVKLQSHRKKWAVPVSPLFCLASCQMDLMFKNKQDDRVSAHKQRV